MQRYFKCSLPNLERIDITERLLTDFHVFSQFPIRIRVKFKILFLLEEEVHPAGKTPNTVGGGSMAVNTLNC
jgi:hypothetical protein